jgi:general secretion pathway protein D
MIRLRVALLAAVSILCGCAASTAYKQGRDLLGQGKEVEALEKLRAAQQIEPTSAEYRMAVIQVREQIVQRQLLAAQQYHLARNVDEAERAYQRVLMLDQVNDKALAGLRAIGRQRQSNEILKAAGTAVSSNNFDEARTRLKPLLLEQPAHAEALALVRRIDEATSRPAPEDAALSAAYRKPIGIEFKDAPLKTVFEVISRASGLNFVFDKDLRSDQKTSIFLKNSTIEAALNMTLLTNQLDRRIIDANTILIYPNTQAKQNDYQPMKVRSFYLANADAKAVAATLKAILKTKDVVIDEKLNLLIIRESADGIRMAEKLVALHDVPEPEVMLEVEILEVKRTRLLDLGIRWPGQLTLTPLSSTSGAALTLNDLRNISGSTLGATIGSASINANKADTDANILANPRIRARNREKAKILIGERVPNITTTATATGFVSESINYVDVGLKLDVEPSIHLDGEVAIKVALEVSNIISQVQTKSGSIAYQIGTRSAQSVLKLKDGENQVLAGLINDEDRRTGNKVPGVGDIPVVGRLFGQQADNSTKTEIVLSITPRILRNISRPDAALIEFDAGTENATGIRTGPGSGATSPSGGTRTEAAATNARPSTASTEPQRQANPVASPIGGTGLGTAILTGGANGPVPVATDNVPGVARWDGPTSAKLGESFALQLSIQSEQPILSIPMAVGFDPKVLQVTSVSEGDFLRQGSAPTSFTSRIDPNGQVVVTVIRTADTGATSLGAVAILNFKVIAAPSAQTAIQLLSIAPTVVGGRTISIPLPLPQTIQLSN